MKRPSRDAIRQAAALAGLPAVARSPEIAKEVQKGEWQALAAARETRAGELIFYYDDEARDTLPLFTNEHVWRAWMQKHHPDWAKDASKIALVSLKGDRYANVTAAMGVKYIRIYGSEYANTMTVDLQYIPGSREKHDLR
jgi:hypothetical protein